MTHEAETTPAPPGHERAARTPRGDARRVALGVLERVEDDGAFADLALRNALRREKLDTRDRAFATELAYGSLRWRGRLDHLLTHVLDRPLDRIEPRVRRVLRLGAYQIAFCERVPDAAAVSESVRLANAVGLQRAAGLVNAALRRLAREWADLPFPALADDPVAHLEHALSIPRWIAERWVAAWGAEQAAAFATISNAAPPLTVRANPQRTTRDALVDELREAFPEAQPCPLAASGVTLGRRGDVTTHAAFGAGRMTVQDQASQLVVELLDPRPGECVLDACAAPGAKATAIAERVGEAGSVVAMDRHERRLGLVARDAARLGLANVATVLADARELAPDAFAGMRFDRILVDAPCSGLGTLRRNPDARWRVRPEAIAQLATLQREILAAVLPFLRPGGTLVYSTCTLAAEENEDVVDWLLARTPALQRTPGASWPAALQPLLDADGALRCWTHQHDADGFFAVRLELRP